MGQLAVCSLTLDSNDEGVLPDQIPMATIVSILPYE